MPNPPHHDDQRYICSTCNKLFKSKAGIKLHAKQHDVGATVENFTETDYKCATCGAMFANKLNLTRHVRLCKKGSTLFTALFRTVKKPLQIRDTYKNTPKFICPLHTNASSAILPSDIDTNIKNTRAHLLRSEFLKD